MIFFLYFLIFCIIFFSAAIAYRAIVTSDGHPGYRVDKTVSETFLRLGGMLSGHVYTISVYSIGRGNVVDFNVVHPLQVQTGAARVSFSKYLIFHCEAKKIPEPMKTTRTL